IQRRLKGQLAEPLRQGGRRGQQCSQPQARKACACEPAGGSIHSSGGSTCSTKSRKSGELVGLHKRFPSERLVSRGPPPAGWACGLPENIHKHFQNRPQVSFRCSLLSTAQRSG